MKGLLRKIFSPKFIIFLVLLAEVVVLVGLWYLAQYFIEDFLIKTGIDGDEFGYEIASGLFLGFRILVYIIDIIVLYTIINKEENPEYKIPWIVLMIFVPTVAFVMYVIFGRKNLRKKDKVIVDETNNILTKLKQDYDDTAIFDELNDYQGVYKYLKKTTHLNLSKNNHLTYFKNGEEFFPDFIESLKKAEEFIFIEFFIIGQGKWWSQTLDVLTEKAKIGVEVRLTYDDIGSFGTIPETFVLDMQSRGIKVAKFHPFRPTLSRTLNNRTHRKIVVVDHKIAYTGGMNLADEYANEIVRFGYWKDTMVKIEGPGIYNLIATYLQNYDLTTFKVSDYNYYLEGEYQSFKEEGFCFAFGDAPGSYNGRVNIGEDNYINLLDSAKSEIYISTPYLITPYPLQNALIRAANRGVKVHLIVPKIPDKKLVYWMAKGEFSHFLKAGIKIYTYTPGFNHEKQMLVDGRLCFIGTINFDFRSLTHHFECGATISDSPIMKQIEEDFIDMVNKSEEVDPSFKMKPIPSFIIGIIKIFRTLL